MPALEHIESVTCMFFFYVQAPHMEACADDEFVTTLLSQISWSNHLAILSKGKTPEERHFHAT